MTRYAAFLRGVNVGGVNLKMAEVAAALERGGVSRTSERSWPAATLLLESRSGVDAVRKKAEARCATNSATTPGCWPTTWTPCGRSVTTTRSTATSTAITATSRSSPTRMCSTSCAALINAGAHEKIKRGKGVVYWQVPNKGTLDTTIGKTMGKKRYKSSTTTRNLRTLGKVLR